MGERINRPAVIAAGLVILAAALLPGQRMTARIVGNVKDDGGNFLGGVLVTATNVKSNAVTSATTAKKKGAFRIPAVDPGIYQVSFDLEGYEALTMSGIQLCAEQSITLRIKLKRKISPSEAAGSL